MKLFISCNVINLKLAITKIFIHIFLKPDVKIQEGDWSHVPEMDIFWSKVCISTPGQKEKLLWKSLEESMVQTSPYSKSNISGQIIVCE